MVVPAVFAKVEKYTRKVNQCEIKNLPCAYPLSSA
jgi:hypothetical protein